jgi:hypothetical protein
VRILTKEWWQAEVGSAHSRFDLPPQQPVRQRRQSLWWRYGVWLAISIMNAIGSSIVRAMLGGRR